MALLVPALAFAASGTIDSVHKYAWGNVAGYVNFAPTNSTVTVTDSSITGSAWSENDGWINFQPAHGGVTNSGGTLSGWAWDESQGWVSFSGVTIDSSGKFHGQATGSNGYTITFDCAYCDVQTTWHKVVSSASNGPAAGTYGAVNGQPQPTQPAPSQNPPSLEPSAPPSAIAPVSGGATSQAGSPYYQLPTQGNSIAISSISAKPHATSSVPAKVPASHTSWAVIGLGALLLLLLAFLALRVI